MFHNLQIQFIIIITTETGNSIMFDDEVNPLITGNMLVTVAADALVLKHQAISIHNIDLILCTKSMSQYILLWDYT